MADNIAAAGKPPTVTIDGKDYAVEQLSENARNQLTNIRVTDQEIARLQQQLAIFRTARATYANALKAEIEQSH